MWHRIPCYPGEVPRVSITFDGRGSMTVWVIFLSLLYIAQTIGALPIIELSLIGTRLNRPVFVISLACVWPLTLPAILVWDAVKAWRR